MNILDIVDLGKGSVRLSWSHGKTKRDYPHPIKFSDPLSKTDRHDLRWYLEEYLQFPYGAERWHAEQVEQRMSVWGGVSL